MRTMGYQVATFFSSYCVLAAFLMIEGDMLCDAAPNAFDYFVMMCVILLSLTLWVSFGDLASRLKPRPPAPLPPPPLRVAVANYPALVNPGDEAMIVSRLPPRLRAMLEDDSRQLKLEFQEDEEEPKE